MKKTIIFLSIELLIIVGFVTASAQTKVKLMLDESQKSSIGNFLFCDKNYVCGFSRSEKSKTSEAGGREILMRVSRMGDDFNLLIDTNRNGDLTDEKEILIKNRLSTNVKIKKLPPSGKISFFPYEISHETKEKNGETIDYFNMVPHYVAAGVLKYKNCSSKIALSDMNFDGEFSFADSKGGTNLHIDRNNDGKFWGREEHNKTTEIIEFCGQNFLPSVLNDDFLTLQPTDLQLAEVGRAVPKFSFTLLNGKAVNTENLKGKSYVLDFWASWCVPCVENLPQIVSLKKNYEKSLSVYSVNVDETTRKSLAEKIIKENGMFDFSAIRGLGENDPLWKTFGGTNLNKLSIPLYVLIDAAGVVRYADNGGEELKELKSSIEKTIQKRQ